MINQGSLLCGLAGLISLPIGLAVFAVIVIWAAGMALCKLGYWAINYEGGQ